MRLVVYLDHSVLSTLAKIPSTTTFAAIRELVAADRVIFPLSWTHHAEAQLDDRVRDGIYRAGAALSRGVRFLPNAQIVAGQALAAYRRFLGDHASEPSALSAFEHDPRGSISERWAKTMVGARVISAPESRELVRRAKKLFADDLNAMREHRKERSFEEARDDYARKAIDFYFVRPQRQALSGEFDVPMLAFSGRVADYAYGTQHQPLSIAEILEGPKRMFEFFGSKECATISAIDIEASILASWEVDEPNRRYGQGDLHDLQTWSAYLPYVDAAIADRHMAEILNRRGLARQYECEVFPHSTAGLQALIDWARS